MLWWEVYKRIQKSGFLSGMTLLPEMHTFKEKILAMSGDIIKLENGALLVSSEWRPWMLNILQGTGQPLGKGRME